MSQGNNRSSNPTKRGENLEPPIPNDIIIEIFSRLPGKSIARFRCLSKLWCSMLCRPYFTELFLTRSSARPRLLFVLEEYDEWSIFSSPQPRNPYGKSSLIVAADFHMKFHAVVHRDICSYASGLVYFPNVWISKDTVPVICNPITGQYAILPNLTRYRKPRSVLGFDPIDKRFKVLAEDYPFYDEMDHHKILTLGTRKLSLSKKNYCPSYHCSVCEGICINGVWYYLVDGCSNEHIVCVDVRSEKFKFIDTECFCDRYAEVKLINYKGRLGGISWEYVGNTFELCMCVLEDVEKQEWSKCVYSLGENAVVDDPFNDLVVVGVTATGEIVLSIKYTSERFYVYYFNPETNSLQSVEIKGFKKHCRVYAFVDHVEDLNVNDAKQLKSRRPLKQGLDIIRKRPKPQEPPKPQERHTSRDLRNFAPPVKNKQPTILLQNKCELLANLE